jgi:hypothetical protein
LGQRSGRLGELQGLHRSTTFPPMRNTSRSFLPTARTRTTDAVPAGDSVEATSENTGSAPARSSQDAIGCGRRRFRLRVSTRGSCDSRFSIAQMSVDRSRRQPGQMTDRGVGELYLVRHWNWLSQHPATHNGSTRAPPALT